MADQAPAPTEQSPAFTAPHVSPDGSIDREYVKRWLDEHWTGSKICPVCGSMTWNPGNYLVNLPGGPTGATLGGKTYPSVVLVCATCGYSFLMNAIVMGVVTIATGSTGESTPDAGAR